MARKELRRYHQHSEGVVKMGSFQVPGEWDETGLIEFHESVTSAGSGWVEGNKKRAEFTVRFGKISPEQANALMLALAGWRQDNTVQVPIALGGTRFDFLYLQKLLVEAPDETPVGLLFSNEVP